MTNEVLQRNLNRQLREIYGKEIADEWTGRYYDLIASFIQVNGRPVGSHQNRLDRHTALLITYGDSLYSENLAPLASLLKFLDTYVGDALSTVHILPFYPSSSDDGFSVVDPFAVDPRLGTWDDIALLGSRYQLMFDLVANHLSRSNYWIQECFSGNPEYKDFAIFLTGEENLRYVFRPRTLPLLTSVDTSEGKRLVWTTFSKDQIDVNYHNPKVLYSMLEVFLAYVGKGVSIVRLDAVAFLWKEFGTSCIHHPKTHAIIRLFSWILDILAPQSFLLTETNVPHRDNISYFGNGSDEATMVYNFPLPPLVYHTFLSQDATALHSWAKTLRLPSVKVSFLNFLASHDGIGLMPVVGILDDKKIEAMAEHAIAQGGFVSRKNEADGTTRPYELNINYFSALSDLVENESETMAIDRFVAACAIMIFFKGIPGIYIHSLVGSQNWYGDPELKVHPRRINREQLNLEALQTELSDSSSIRAKVLSRQLQLLQLRKAEPAFSATADQDIPECSNPSCFIIERRSHQDSASLLVVVNVSSLDQVLCLEGIPSFLGPFENLMGEDFGNLDNKEIVLRPYQVAIFKQLCLSPQ
ncbi:alpha-amylase family glycosyl hydrolase [uncultured Sphaerochaeta sp.]|uniref:alpha-amylase family glycosyl hydrolase n=1 Tax=uncultured Sphaerochaeta sp. TaxID=886478 RepID=UPI002A0A9537|nr:alpha-amylase family glycosyl hydrolase [uncultured Sphaerochaeta sp.]